MITESDWSGLKGVLPEFGTVFARQLKECRRGSLELPSTSKGAAGYMLVCGTREGETDVAPGDIVLAVPFAGVSVEVNRSVYIMLRWPSDKRAAIERGSDLDRDIRANYEVTVPRDDT